MKIPFRAEDPVTRKELMYMLASFAAFIITAAAVVSARAENVARDAARDAKQEVLVLKEEVAVNKREADAGTAEVRKDIQAVYNFLLTRQRQERLEAKK